MTKKEGTQPEGRDGKPGKGSESERPDPPIRTGGRKRKGGGHELPRGLGKRNANGGIRESRDVKILSKQHKKGKGS